VRALALALLAAAPVPTPIGTGPRYDLPAAPPAVRRAEPIGRLRCASGDLPHQRAHVELFANRRALLLPPGIGMAPPLRRDGADVLGARCSYPLRTTDPTGVVELAAAVQPTLGDLFAVWGQPLGPSRLCSFRGAVRAWVGGRRWRGDVRRIPLTRHAQVVVEVGDYVPPHPTYLFPRTGDAGAGERVLRSSSSSQPTDERRKGWRSHSRSG
jgi:hypothetical protein